MFVADSSFGRCLKMEKSSCEVFIIRKKREKSVLVPLRAMQRKQRSLEENWRNSYRESLHCLLLGKVYLIGSGPGEQGFLPMRGRELLEQADAVVYDALAGDAVLGWIPEHTRKIDVGKRSGRHSKKQEEILEILLEEAKKGGTIVRLKGGDPFVFGRGGEEAEFLKKHRSRLRWSGISPAWQSGIFWHPGDASRIGGIVSCDYRTSYGGHAGSGF